MILTRAIKARLRTARWRAKYPERNRSKVNVWHEGHRAERRAYMKQYYRTHRQDYRAYGKAKRARRRRLRQQEQIHSIRRRWQETPVE